MAVSKRRSAIESLFREMAGPLQTSLDDRTLEGQFLPVSVDVKQRDDAVEAFYVVTYPILAVMPLVLSDAFVTGSNLEAALAAHFKEKLGGFATRLLAAAHAADEAFKAELETA